MNDILKFVFERIAGGPVSDGDLFVCGKCGARHRADEFICNDDTVWCEDRDDFHWCVECPKCEYLHSYLDNKGSLTRATPPPA